MVMKKLEEIADVFSGVQVSRFVDPKGEKTPIIKNKFTDSYSLDYYYENISNSINEKYYSKKGDIIISLSQPNTVSIIHEDGFIIPMYFAVIRVNEMYDPSFIYHLISSKDFHKKLHIFCEGGALRVIKVAALKSIKLNIPNLEKQKQYGEFFNLIDKKNMLIDLKKDYNDKIKEYLIQTQINGEEMSNYQNSLESKLWAIADDLRGNMDANEFKNYILGFIFYRYLSEKLELHMNEELKEDELTFEQAWADDDFKQDLIDEGITALGYFLEPQYLFSNLIKKAKVNEFILGDLVKSLNYISNSSMGTDSQDDFSNLFEDVDLNSSKLGKSDDDKNKLISKILLNLNDIDFKLEDDESDILGDAYEYLISQFASSAGKKAGEFYTPQEVSKILAKIVTLNKTKIRNVYDPTCGSGSLLLRVSKEVEVGDFCGQELNQTTYNLARMNMILHGVKYVDFDIKQGDSLLYPQHVHTKFEAIVANPPFSAKWSSDKGFLDDDRFSAYGKLAPKSKADYAFVQHMLFHLDENGTMAIVLPHGVLFRGAAEGVIRKYLVDEKNYLDAVIGLPANIFYGTSIPTVILVFKKCREEEQDVLFIDASKEFEKVKNQNKLRPEDIDKIVNTYANREEIEKYSHKATMDEIRENDFNLNIPRYVDTFEEEEPIDLDEVVSELKKINEEMKNVDAEIKKYCDELGIQAPIFD